MAQTEESRISGENPSKLIELNRSLSISMDQSGEILQKELTKGQQGYGFERIGTESDELGYTYDIFQETYNGLKVEFAVQKLHSFQGKLRTISGDFYNTTGLDLNPKINAETAFKNAVQFIGADKYLWEDEKSASIMDDYENPVTDNSLTIQSNREELQYEIINASSQYVMSGALKNGNIDISQLSKGVYLLKLSSGDALATKRFIRN
ncbi:MAG: T9SS type A sorting domain-containing protein [Bacteroidota bacterium]